MRYLIKLISTRYRSDNNKFAIYLATEVDYSSDTTGLAYVVFKNTLPVDSEGYLEIWGDWVDSEKHGLQLEVRSWIKHDTIPKLESSDSANPADNDESTI